MKRIDYNLEGDLLSIVFPNHMIKDRKELLIILLETLRYILIAETIEQKAHVQQRVVLYIDEMKTIFLFDKKKYYSLAIPFTLQLSHESSTLIYNNIEIDAEIISNIITILQDDSYQSSSYWDFFSLVDEQSSKGVELWAILKHLMTYDIGYLRFDDDEEGFRKAKGHGIPLRHPRYHIDVNLSNASTFKHGLSTNICPQDFINIIDNKKDRWTLSI